MSDRFSAALEELERSGHRPERFSEPFVAFLPITGAAVSTLGEVLGSETISATDALAARLDEIQFDLGEGPCWDAMLSAAPVSEPDVHAGAPARWPAFAEALRADPISSIYAFPLVVGPLRLGAVDLYSLRPLHFDDTSSKRAESMAEIIGRHVLRGAVTASESPTAEDANPRSRRVVHQATGVVLAQLATPPDEALLIIQAHAFATGRPMIEVATQILEGQLVFRRQSGRIEVA